MANLHIIFDLRPIVKELKNTNIQETFKNVGRESELMRKIIEIEKEWKIILSKFEKLSEKIAKEGISKSLEINAFEIAEHCKKLGTIAGPLLVEGGSFVPGPVGIVCSLALAIIDFAAGNIFGGFMNLLGCIPFAKAGVKAARPIIKQLNEIISALLRNKEFVKYVKNASSALKPTTGLYTRKVMPEANRMYNKIFSKSSSVSPHQIKPQATGVGFYSQTGEKHFQSLEEILQANARRTGEIKVGQYGPNYSSINYEEYILRTNMGKNNPFCNLGY